MTLSGGWYIDSCGWTPALRETQCAEGWQYWCRDELHGALADSAAVHSRPQGVVLPCGNDRTSLLTQIERSNPCNLASELPITGDRHHKRTQSPLLQAGRDALVNAPTGSGKTLAYLAPIINDLQVSLLLINLYNSSKSLHRCS